MARNKKTIKMSETNHFFTKSVHFGRRKFKGEPVAVPIYQTSIFRFPTIEELLSVYHRRIEGYTYTRSSNPTVRVAERKLAELEDAEDGVAFSSGMAAISTTILSLASVGDHIVSIQDIYGGTYHLFTKVLSRLGIEVSFVKTTDVSGVKEAIRNNTKAVFVESPTNPLLKIVDLSEIAMVAKEKDVTTIIDSTFATPYNQQPVKFGFDLVIHSGTKYLGGHDDLTAGIVSGSSKFISAIYELRRYLGGALSPYDAWTLLRGIMTLGLRIERQNFNAMKIAEFLEDHKRVKKVYYPGLESHPQHKIAKKQMCGFGGVLSFEVRGNIEAAKRFLNNVKLCSLAPSLGGVKTLVTSPAMTSHRYMSEEQRLECGIKDELIRLSVGIEDVADIIKDLDRTLKSI